uniref:OCEL domain-containing protein n=1 Tax=Periophthalmus magnuspinnatus TaxID=409849 RepID=A0A3B4ALS3_9GOBI
KLAGALIFTTKPTTKISNIVPYKSHDPIVFVCYRKYPEITCLEQREEYRAVFNDQYQEYRDLHRHISLTLSKFRQLDMLMDKLLRDSTQNPQRIQSLLQTLEEKKNDPTFWEKKQRCDYLKAKLSHLKIIGTDPLTSCLHIGTVAFHHS